VNGEVRSGRVLLVEDDEDLCTAFARILRSVGLEVETAESAEQALQRAKTVPFDVVVTDIHMNGGMDGIVLLKELRRFDPELPVLLVTGDPTVDSAVEAVELRALRYLRKPVEASVLRSAVQEALHLGMLSKLRREAFEETRRERANANPPVPLAAGFDAALEGIWIAFHPIVSWSARRVVGYEASVRSSEPRFGSPDLLFGAAEELNRVHELGRVIRRTIARAMHNAPPDADIFVNVHPRDLEDPELTSDESPLTLFSSRVVLEVTERASLERIEGASAVISRLRRLGYRIAVDDLGAGYAGLSSLIQLQPEVVKLDMALVRNVHEAPTKQQLIRALVGLCREMGVLVVAEGIETTAERDALVELGCDLLQGFLFTRPTRAFWNGLEA
jgi:EAL domain-containing protein (putative c-di-GMP-specific phosphodiesterase class I)